MKVFLGVLLAVCGFAPMIPAADLTQFKTADQLWTHIRRMKEQGPSERADTQEQQQAIAKNFLHEIDTALAEFANRYPTDSRRWEASLTRIMAANVLANIEGRSPDDAADEKSLKEIVAGADAPVEVKTIASIFLIQIHAGRLSSSPDAALLAALDAEIAAFEKNYPQNPQLAPMKLLLAHAYQKADPAKAESLMKALAKSSNQEVASEAQYFLAVLEIGKKPLQLKFTALDGSTVDLEKLRGKVVLLDFWATWCGPCVVSLPNVLVTYSKLHGKGFEIVGISLDQDKDKLTAFTKQRGMTWPQYFDGKAWQNDVSVRFSVNAIPALWLVDKKGYARPMEGDDLSAAVEKLLSE